MNPQSGLYILIFENFRDVSINDRNLKEKNDKKVNGQKSLSGKIVIPPNKWVIKFGKFQRYFLRRMKEYSDHMHFVDDPQKNGSPIFNQVLRSTFLLPLDECKLGYINPAAMFEPYWNASLHNFLHINNYLVEGQNFRSEYRVVRKIEANDLELLLNYTQSVADKISKISTIFE